MPPVTRREILLLAAPAAASAILGNAYRIIDQYAVQGLGVPAQAAIGSCTFVLIAIYAVYAIVDGGTGPLVGRATGAGDAALRRRVIGSALTGALLLFALIAAGVSLAAGGIAATLGLTGQTAIEAATYLRWLALCGVGLATAGTVEASLFAMGRTGLAMGLQLLSTLLNAVLNPLFIYSLGLGIGGAALATGVARVVSLALGLFLLRGLTGLRLSDFGLDPVLRRVMRVGLPIASNVLAYALVYWALLRWAVSPLGPAVNAALGVGFSALEGFTWPMYLGVSIATASVVSRRLGAGQPEEARRAFRLALPISVGLGLGSAAAFFFGAPFLTGLFTDDPVVWAQAILYARVLAASQLFVSLESLAEGTLEGAGDTRTIFRWSAPLNALRVPLGWALALPLGLGPAGVWWAINLTSLAKCLGKGRAVLRGAWLDIDV